MHRAGTESEHKHALRRHTELPQRLLCSQVEPCWPTHEGQVPITHHSLFAAAVLEYGLVNEVFAQPASFNLGRPGLASGTAGTAVGRADVMCDGKHVFWVAGSELRQLQRQDDICKKERQGAGGGRGHNTTDSDRRAERKKSERSVRLRHAGRKGDMAQQRASRRSSP